MFNSDDYRKYLLLTIPGAKPASGGREINCRCFECPDSEDRSHGHFYISIPQKEDEPSKFYCQKCHCRGWVTHHKLLDWGIYNDAIAIDLITHNRSIELSGTRKFDSREVYRINNDYITMDELSERKLSYINNRLGLKLTYDDLLDKKIVLNLNDLLKRNNVALTRNYNIVNELDQSFIGFISLDNAFCNMRRLVSPGKIFKSIDKRYVNYDIYKKFDNTERYYTIPTNIDMNRDTRIPLHIAEGAFDILSIYYNLRNQENGIYTSVAGSNYKGIVRHFITSMGLPYIELHLYPDNDMSGSVHVMADIAELVAPLGIPMYVHRNASQGQKDFGVSPDKIIEKTDRII